MDMFAFEDDGEPPRKNNRAEHVQSLFPTTGGPIKQHINT